MAAPVVTAIFSGESTFICDLSAAADADTGETLINHGILGLTATGPAEIYICPVLTGAAATDPGWAITTRNATQIGITKGKTGAGSAFAAAVSARCIVKRPHSSGR